MGILSWWRSRKKKAVAPVVPTGCPCRTIEAGPESYLWGRVRRAKTPKEADALDRYAAANGYLPTGALRKALAERRRLMFAQSPEA